MNLSKFHSEASLAAKMVEFGRLLKHEGLDVTHARIADALRACKHINLFHKEEFYTALNANLVSRREDLQVFAALFRLFWEAHEEMEGQEEQEEDNEAVFHRESSEFVLPFAEEKPLEESTETRMVPAASLYESLIVKDFSLLCNEELEYMQKLMMQAMRRLRLRLGRRYKASLAFQKLDFRRSFRNSLRVGGELIDLKFRRRKPRKVEIVLLLDVSGSMDVYGRFFLQFMFSLQKAVKDVESFVFSTRLSRITPFLQNDPLEQGLAHLTRLPVNWSGGTNIGSSLEEFCTQYLDALKPGRKVIALIASDGWDRGSPETLRSAMGRLRTRVYKIFWLNPLLASPRYQPLCIGIRTALPYVDYFLPFNNLKSVLTLARLLEKAAAGAELTAL
jgi:uncharacterized protein with von Willebrand factor type A (vWA) domain